MNTLFIFNGKMFWEVNYTHIFVWRRPCNLIDYSKMAMCLTAPVILWLYTQGAALSDLLFSLPWVLLAPRLRWAVSFRCGPLQRVWTLHLRTAVSPRLFENWLLFHWRLTKALLWLGYVRFWCFLSLTLELVNFPVWQRHVIVVLPRISQDAQPPQRVAPNHSGQRILLGHHALVCLPIVC